MPSDNNADSTNGDASCCCPHINVGRYRTKSRNWNRDCPAHGMTSDWYRDHGKQRMDEQQAATRALQAKAAEARRQHRNEVLRRHQQRNS